MLDLYASVHLDEVEVAVFIEELERTGAAVADIDARLDAAGLHLAAGFFVDQRGRGLLNHLLVTALQRAVAIAEVDGVALRSEEHTSELQSLMRISYAVFCLKKKKQNTIMQ